MVRLRLEQRLDRRNLKLPKTTSSTFVPERLWPMAYNSLAAHVMELVSKPYSILDMSRADES